VRVRLDRKATAISLLVVIGVRADGQKVSCSCSMVLVARALPLARRLGGLQNAAGPQIRCSITASFTNAHGRFRMPIALVVEATGLNCYYIAGI
jgi:hypothetical protein